MNRPDVSVIIVAAGSGRRLGLATPKAFVMLAGMPIFEHSLKAFSKTGLVSRLILVIPPRRRLNQGSLRKRYPKLLSVVHGGRERTDSVRAGLAAVPPWTELLLVHDAARPLVSPRDIESVIRAAQRHGAAILAEPLTDTVKRVDRGLVRATLNRRLLWRAQTPQGFRRRLLERCHGRDVPWATDDSSLAEALGAKVAVVPATGPNFKITTRIDLETAACLLAKKRSA